MLAAVVLFLQYTFPFIKRPIFVLNSLYDTAQLSGILGLKCLPPNCDADQMKYFENFRNVSLTDTLLSRRSSVLISVSV